MRTNKKCPLYNEEGEPVAWQDLGAAADGLLERQGTKITIKRKPISTRKMDELDSPISVQPPVVKTPLPKKDIPAPTPLLKTPSLRMKIKLISGGTPNPPSDDSPAPSTTKPPREKAEKVHGAHANGAGETPPGASIPARPLLKLKLSNQKQRDQGVKRLKQDVDVEAARKERERIRERERQEREAYEQALVEEREREEKEREEKEKEKEKEKERQDREEREFNRRATGVHANDAARGNKVENKLVIVNKASKKRLVRPKDDSELLRKRERMEKERKEAEEYRRALDEELKREQEELERKEERERAEKEERHRIEQAKMERERHRQHMKEKERRRERERVREEARAREVELEAQRAAQEREEREERERLEREEELQQRERGRIRQKNMKVKHMKERTKVISVPTSGLSEKERGKGLKRRPDPPPPSYHHTPDYGNAPKRLRKKGGEVSS